MELQEKSISLSKLNTNRLIYHFSGIILLAIFIANVTYSVSIPFISNPDNSSFSYSYYDGLGRIGDYPRPTNPMIDRATGYLLAGKAKSAMQNYGNFTSWEEFPAGGWINYSYLPNLSFIAGVPGHLINSDQDCNGDCFGVAYVDECDICSEGLTGHEADSDKDCNGDGFGMILE